MQACGELTNLGKGEALGRQSPKRLINRYSKASPRQLFLKDVAKILYNS